MSSGPIVFEDFPAIASWPWMAEVVRSTCSQLYALGGRDDSQRTPRHSNEILTEVRRRFGELEGFSPTKDSLRSIFRLLLRLGDIAHVRRGAYVPRETRILLFSPTHARIAGGLPLLFSEYRDEGIVVCADETIGRIAEISFEAGEFPREWSLSRCFTWGQMSVPERLEYLLSRCRRQTAAIAENVSFYNPSKIRAYIRSSRWQIQCPALKHSIARRGGTAYDYFLVSDSGSTSERWFEISSEDAKSWLVVIDQMVGAVHSVRKLVRDGAVHLSLPKNMPEFCIEALVSASSELHDEDAMWHFCVPVSLSPLVDYVCSITAIYQHE